MQMEWDPEAARTYIYLTWGPPPARDYRNFWQWSNYVKQFHAWTAALPQEFLDCHGYCLRRGLDPTTDSEQLIEQLTEWISKKS